MSEDANQVETPETPAAAPESQPAQGGDTPAAAPAKEPVSAQPGPGVNQPPQMIPKWRFDEVNEQLKALRQQPPAQPQPAAKPSNQPPKPEEFGDDFQAYQDARAAYIADQRYEQRRAAEKQQEYQQSEQQQRDNAEANLYQKAQEASAKYPDFMAVVTAAPRLTNPNVDLAFKASPNVGELAYHLGKNPDLVLRLNGMHPVLAIAEMGRIEGRLNGSSGQPQKKPSAGIPDLDPVGKGNKPGAVDPYAPDTSVEDYVRLTRPLPKRR